LHGSGYAAGPRLLHLAVRTLDQVHAADRLKASVETLAEQTGESATAGLLVGNEIVLVARKEPAHSLRAVARVGDVLHPHTSAMGKAVLAMLPTPRQLDILRTAVGEHAEQALTDTHAELATAREQGFAVDEESYAIGLRCRAAAILDRSGHAVGGISIAGPAARFTRENANACVPALLAETRRLSLETRSTR
ncbi:hypothetical protein FAF44_52675, partial [Nonomuraea sp. MG754425]|uniref:IclR family transcriptional regulator n=1 Tax=Nonomuraea sp. MG754425 TaxID=2570319 RepID=UPI001F3C8C61